MALSGSRWTMQWFMRPVLLATAAFLMLLAATGSLGLRSWNEREATRLGVERSSQVVEALDRLQADVARLENERRSYLLTRDQIYLEHNNAAEINVREGIVALQALVTDDPLQSLRAEHLALVAEAKLPPIDRVLETESTSGRDAALALIESVDEITLQIAQMQDVERLLLARLQARVDALQQNTIWFIGAAVVVATIFATVAFALARIEAARRRKATEENARLNSDLKIREGRIRRLIDSNVIGIVIWDLDGRLIDANDAFLRIVQYERGDLTTGLRWLDMTPPDWQEVHARSELEELQTTGIMQTREKEFFRKDGSRVPVLIGAAAFEHQPNQGVAFILDLTNLKRAEAEARESERRYSEVQIELAHANRVATMGQLAGSIAHEVSQPVAAAAINAGAALNWLLRQEPDLDQARLALTKIVGATTRAGEVIGRIRDMIKKAAPQKDVLEINGPIRQVIDLMHDEATRNAVLVRAELADGLPFVRGDRVQLQQVILNLILNAIEAMSSVQDGARDLLIRTVPAESGDVLVVVLDTGPGLDSESTERIFESFYTTKSSGMGMGLSICRSIIDAHKGRLWVIANEPRGTIFQFTLPPWDGTVASEHPRASHMTGDTKRAQM